MGLSKKQLKTIAELERREEMCRNFMNDWLLFNQILSAYPNPGANKAQLENQFLKIKSKLAREHKVLKDSLMEDYAIDGNAMNIVSGATNLEAIYSQSEVAVKKLQGEWHRAFISINETLGVLENKKTRAQAGEKIVVLTAADIAGGKAPKGGGDSGTMKTLMIIGAVIAVIALVFIINPGGFATMYIQSFKDVFGL